MEPQWDRKQTLVYIFQFVDPNYVVTGCHVIMHVQRQLNYNWSVVACPWFVFAIAWISLGGLPMVCIRYCMNFTRGCSTPWSVFAIAWISLGGVQHQYRNDNGPVVACHIRCRIDLIRAPPLPKACSLIQTAAELTPP